MLDNIANGNDNCDREYTDVDADDAACIDTEDERVSLLSGRVKSKTFADFSYRGKFQQYFTNKFNAQSRQRQQYSTLRAVKSKYLPIKQQQRQLSYRKMSTDVASAAAAAISNENIQLPPLRTLDDFVLGSARFQLPNLRDLEKWGNRVVKNLLYYQTNYFLLFLGIYALMIILNPVKIACGLLVQALLIAILLHFFREKSGSKASFIAKRAAAAAGAGNNDSQQKWYFLAGTILFGYLLLYWFDAVLLTLFTLLLPISLTFVHASLRLRNMKNKVVNTMESFSPSTPMGIFLDTLNISGDGILN